MNEIDKLLLEQLKQLRLLHGNLVSRFRYDIPIELLMEAEGLLAEMDKKIDEQC